jgi:hypothetical protein
MKPIFWQISGYSAHTPRSILGGNQRYINQAKETRSTGAAKEKEGQA